MKMLFFFLFFLTYLNYFLGVKSFTEKLLEKSDCNCNSELNYELEKSKDMPPWQITIKITNARNDEKKICGAIVLNRKFIASSSNCFKNIIVEEDEPIISIFRGLKIDDGFFDSTIEIENLTFSENYIDHEFDEDHYLYSFVLIELKDYLNFNDKLKPACLLDASFKKSYVGSKLIMGGWLYTEEIFTDENFRTLPLNKKFNKFKDKFFIVNYASHTISYTNNVQEDIAYEFCLKKEILCITPKIVSACYGSEGSPLYLKTGNKYHVVAMNILNYPMYMNNTLTGIPIYGQCLRNKFDMFLKIEGLFDIINKHIGNDSFCKLKFPGNSDPELKKPTFKRASYIFNRCNCSTELLGQISSELLTLGPEGQGFFESDNYGWIAQIFSFKETYYYLACTGVIINTFHILTTATCLFEYYRKGFYLYLNNSPFIESNFIDHELYIKVNKYFFDTEFSVFRERDYFGIMRLEKEIDFKRYPHFKPACFPRLDDTNDYSFDSLFTLSQKLDEKKPRTPSKKGRNLIYANTFSVDKSSYALFDKECNPSITTCLVSGPDFKFTQEGSILHRIVRRSIQVISMFSHTHSIWKESHLSVFIDIKPKLEWIYNYIGGSYEICEMDESNKKINKFYCSCEFSLKDIGKTMPWYVSILKYKKTSSRYYNVKPVCRGTILNDFWVLSTAECFYKYQNEDLYASISSFNTRNEYFFKQKISIGEIIKIVYSIPHAHYDNKTNDNNIALFKLTKKILNRNVNFAPACFVNLLNETNFEDDFVLISVNNTLVSLTENSLNKPYCKDKQNVCFTGNNETMCDYEMGSPVVKSINHKSYVIGFYSELITTECESKKEYQVKRISNYLSWINKIIGQSSYCVENSFSSSAREHLCFCYSTNNDVLITHHFSDLALTVVCSGVILSEFFVATATSCFPNDFHVKNYLVVTDSNSNSEDKIIVSDLLIKPYHISGIYRNNGPIALLRTEKKLKLGKETSFFPACLSKDKEISRLKNINFMMLRSQNSMSYVDSEIRKHDICDNVHVYCVTTEKDACISDNGVSVKRFLIDEDTQLKRYFTFGLYEKLNFSKKEGVVNRLIFNDNWVTKKIGISRICSLEKEDEKLLPCNCKYRGTLKSRIFNGSEVPSKSFFSFLAQIVFYQERPKDERFNAHTVMWVNLICGAVIIHYDWVLTSKNAIKPYDIPSKRGQMLLGIGNKFSEDHNHYFPKDNLMEIIKIVYHTESDVDLALLRVAPPLSIGEEYGLYAPCIARNPHEIFDETLLFVLGFGYSKTIKQKRKPISVDFKMIRYNTYTDQEAMRKKYPTLCDETRFCVPGNLGSVCAGDAGGPLLEIKNNVIELIGIIYTNKTSKLISDLDPVSCNPSEISVFTLINANYYDWMSKITNITYFCEYSA